MAQAQARMIKRSLKTPEGRFSLCTDRPLSCHFNPARPPRLTLATLTMGLDAGMYLIFNVMDSLHICTLGETNKVSQCGRMDMALCHECEFQASLNDSPFVTVAVTRADTDAWLPCSKHCGPSLLA